MSESRRRIRFLIDYEGPFLTLSRIGAAVYDDGDEVGSETAPPGAVLEPFELQWLDTALITYLRRLDDRTPRQQTLPLGPGPHSVSLRAPGQHDGHLSPLGTP